METYDEFCIERLMKLNNTLPLVERLSRVLNEDDKTVKVKSSWKCVCDREWCLIDGVLLLKSGYVDTSECKKIEDVSIGSLARDKIKEMYGYGKATELGGYLIGDMGQATRIYPMPNHYVVLASKYVNLLDKFTLKIFEHEHGADERAVQVYKELVAIFDGSELIGLLAPIQVRETEVERFLAIDDGSDE